MESFKCTKTFFVGVVDGDGFTIENAYIDIPEDSIWYMPQDEDFRFIGGEVRLESDEFGWIEISNQTFREHFDEIGKCLCYKLGESLRSGMKCSNCGRGL